MKKLWLAFLLALTSSCIKTSEDSPAPENKSEPQVGSQAESKAEERAIKLKEGDLESAKLFTHIAGFQLPVEFASSSLGLIKNNQGEVIKIAAGNHIYEQAIGIYDIRGQLRIGDTNVDDYPQLTRERTLTRNALFPQWDTRQDIRDIIITSSDNGANNRICGVGRVFYNQNPQPNTFIHCRETTDNLATLGPAERISVDIPEQWVTGFGATPDRLLGGGYDSGQGTTMGPTMAKRLHQGNWHLLFRSPSLGDFTGLIPLLPRPLGYSCPAGNHWVCYIGTDPTTGEPVGIWTTERIWGGGAEFGKAAMLLPTLGFGPRDYSVQEPTFGDRAKDKTYAYYFREDEGTGQYKLQNYDEWPFSNQGEDVIGMKVGKLTGLEGNYLFVVRNNAYRFGMYKSGSVVDIFRINEQP